MLDRHEAGISVLRPSDAGASILTHVPAVHASAHLRVRWLNTITPSRPNHHLPLKPHAGCATRHIQQGLEGCVLERADPLQSDALIWGKAGAEMI